MTLFTSYVHYPEKWGLVGMKLLLCLLDGDTKQRDRYKSQGLVGLVETQLFLGHTYMQELFS